MFILRRRIHPLAKHFPWHFHLSPLLFTPVKKIEIKINLLCIYYCHSIIFILSFKSSLSFDLSYDSVIWLFLFCNSILLILSFFLSYHSVKLLSLSFYQSVILLFSYFCHSIIFILSINPYYNSIFFTFLWNDYSYHSVIPSFLILSFDLSYHSV